MQIAKVENNEVLEVGDYRSLFPNVSFPLSGPDDQFLLDNNALRVRQFKEFNPLTEKLIYGDPYIEDGFVYVIKVQPLTQDEIDAIQEGYWDSVRIERNRLLAESDWTQLLDAPLSAKKQAAWAAYRKALRNITNQKDPLNIIWPKTP